MRLMVIAARAEYRLLVESTLRSSGRTHHCRTPVGEDTPLDRNSPRPASMRRHHRRSAAVGRKLICWRRSLLAKPEFAPMVLLHAARRPHAHRGRSGLHRLYGRKIDRDRLIKAHRGCLASIGRRTPLRRATRISPSVTASARVIIRGHRCIRQVGSGGMCKIYLAESERAGTLVVLKVFNQVPDVSERIVSFDRFLQEYEIVAGLKHQNIVRIYDLGVADDHAYIAMEHFPPAICGSA
jgi:hypothetical protein